jgi:hypothetical protein
MNKLGLIDVKVKEQKLLETKLTELGSHYADPEWRNNLNEVISYVVTEHSEFDENIHGVCKVIDNIKNFLKSQTTVSLPVGQVADNSHGHPSAVESPRFAENIHNPILSNVVQQNSVHVNGGTMFMGQNLTIQYTKIEKAVKAEKKKLEKLQKKEEALEKKETTLEKRKTESKGDSEEFEKVEKSIEEVDKMIEKTEKVIEKNEKKLKDIEKMEAVKMKETVNESNEGEKDVEDPAPEPERKKDPVEEIKSIHNQIKEEEEKMKQLQDKLEGDKGYDQDSDKGEIETRINEIKKKIEHKKSKVKKLKKNI